ncbi:endo alpha-1,4 polygalactosaminidase [Actinophytocola sediminis]
MFDYQLGGAYPPADEVTVVVRDGGAEPAPDRYNICYVNVFQTQPAARARWLADHPDLVLRDDADVPLVDENWPDEMILDTRHTDALVEVLAPNLHRCADSGFDAVEFDNLDSYLRSAGALTLADNLAVAEALVAVAHEDGLAAGQKNTVELGARGRAAGFDFAVVEECVRHDECAAYAEVYGERVLPVEYTDDWADPAEACVDAPPATIVRDRDLVAPGEPGHVYRRC